ncbi:Uncharacterised protein [Raoultella terrigena]|uniref:Uncharacterized protein n=1 Tax=Raoultella terrigena TaxID=577 RepID=A0A4U9D9Y1_RAOTE|nr:Uncharacterised protein [Raoultella terrigena]
MGVIFDDQIDLLIQRNGRPQIVNVNSMRIYGAIGVRAVVGIVLVVIIMVELSTVSARRS